MRKRDGRKGKGKREVKKKKRKKKKRKEKKKEKKKGKKRHHEKHIKLRVHGLTSYCICNLHLDVESTCRRDVAS